MHHVESLSYIPWRPTGKCLEWMMSTETTIRSFKLQFVSPSCYCLFALLSGDEHSHSRIESIMARIARWPLSHHMRIVLPQNRVYFKNRVWFSNSNNDVRPVCRFDKCCLSLSYGSSFLENTSQTMHSCDTRTHPWFIWHTIAFVWHTHALVRHTICFARYVNTFVAYEGTMWLWHVALNILHTNL